MSHLGGDTDVAPAYRRRIQSRPRQPDLSGRLVVHGPVTRERVASLYAAADIFALPIYLDPYATAYAEEMVAGLPVLAGAGNLPHLARAVRARRPVGHDRPVGGRAMLSA